MPVGSLVYNASHKAYVRLLTYVCNAVLVEFIPAPRRKIRILLNLPDFIREYVKTMISPCAVVY